MPLFQTSVLKKYIAQQDKETAAKAFKKFSKYFGNTVIQQNIHDSKEEQFQEGFFRELFVNVFGFTLNPNPDYNLTTEFKNQKGAKKADGAILLNGDAIAVIELKGTKTKDLENVRQQAFDYKANQPECVYVITSNFEKLRFYINNAVEFEEFDLFHLTPDRFELLYLCLAQENLLSNLPLKIKEASIQEEEAITKKFYAAYSLFKRELFRDLVKNNVKNEVFRAELQTENIERATKNIKLNLFQKSQKLIDRFLFIFFAEDRGLLPPNSTILILEEWNKLRELDEIVPLYNRFKKYFNYLDLGRRETAKKAEIFAYNGGLFKPDTVLDSLIINDELIYKHTKALAGYDFESQVDVNILGHIFENSLNEIESVNAEIEGTEFDKQKTKRKKDGVFYTPKYITKYIVDNTVGKLCTDKKAELNMDETEFTPNRQKDTKKRLLDLLETYREWLLQLTILDPACGSGAFLNQALDFLIKEHQYIDELQTQLLGGGFVFPNIENTVLENNIYGVDLNEESVEIAKLSLWLRTAQPRRKLNDLSSNIKCGNSLIDSRSVAGNKAFHWQTEFPEIFKKGGFDVVIGNPPYVRQELFGEIKPYLEKHYKVYDGVSDLFAYFYEKAFQIMTKNGVFGFISNTFDKTKAANQLRAFLTSETNFINYVDFTEVQIFEGATTYPIILIAENSPVKNDKFQYIKIPKASQGNVIDIDIEQTVEVAQNSLEEASWSFNSMEDSNLLKKLNQNKSVKESYGKCYFGVKTALNEAFITENNFRISNHVKQIYEGKEIKKWNTPEPFQKLILFKSKWTKSVYGEDITEEEAFLKLQNDFPNLSEYLIQFEDKAKKRYDKGDFWWELRNCAYYDLLEKPKIIFPNLQNQNKFCLDSKGVFVNAPAVFLPTENKTLLCILNSKVTWFFLKSICVVRNGGYIEVKPQYFEQIPIPELKNEDIFTEKADAIIANTAELQSIQSTFQTYLQSQFSIEKLSKKLQNWYELPFADFIKELNKAIKTSGGSPLSKLQEMDWMEVFETKKAAAQTLKTQINTTDQEIDQLVYQLYDLTEAEIKLVEEST
jgi:type I restriction-modification system DNA methylase subunit